MAPPGLVVLHLPDCSSVALVISLWVLVQIVQTSTTEVDISIMDLVLIRPSPLRCVSRELCIANSGASEIRSKEACRRVHVTHQLVAQQVSHYLSQEEATCTLILSCKCPAWPFWNASAPLSAFLLLYAHRSTSRGDRKEWRNRT